MTYAVKEMHYTLQGEGAQAGTPAILIRFAGCNLWTGLESQRAAAVCRFCDTDFIGVDGPGGGKFATAEALVRTVVECVPAEGVRPLAVCTGGEPLLQLDEPLIAELHRAGFRVAVETNGTLAAPPGLDWVCVSPKGGAPMRQRSGDELKVIFPQPGLDPDALLALDFRHFFLQPLDGPQIEENTRLAVKYCLADPRWRLSIQSHKLLGIP